MTRNKDAIIQELKEVDKKVKESFLPQEKK